MTNKAELTRVITVAVKAALDEIGLARFKETSLFMSNGRAAASQKIAA